MRIGQNIMSELLAAAKGGLTMVGFSRQGTSGGGFESFLTAGDNSVTLRREQGSSVQRVTSGGNANDVNREGQAQPNANVARVQAPSAHQNDNGALVAQESNAPSSQASSQANTRANPSDEQTEGQETDGSSQAEASEGEEVAVISETEEADASVVAVHQALFVEIARMLNIEPDELVQILDSISMDLADLVKSENISLLLQEVFESSPGELLGVEGIVQIYEDLQEAVLRHVPQIQDQATQTTKAANSPIVIPAEAIVPQASGETLETLVRQEVAQPVAEASEASAVQTTAGQDFAQAFADGNTGQQQQSSYNPQVAVAQPQTSVDITQTADGAVVVKETTVAGQTTRVVSTISVPQGGDVNSADVVRQIVDKMKLDLRGAMVNEMRLTLRPDTLGDITLRIITQNGIVTAHFVAENNRVKEIIEAQMSELRQALVEQGIQVSDLNVSVDTNSAEERMRQLMEQQAEASRRINSTTEDGEPEAEEGAEILRDGTTVEFSA